MNFRRCLSFLFFILFFSNFALGMTKNEISILGFNGKFENPGAEKISKDFIFFENKIIGFDRFSTYSFVGNRNRCAIIVWCYKTRKVKCYESAEWFLECPKKVEIDKEKKELKIYFRMEFVKVFDLETLKWKKTFWRETEICDPKNFDEEGFKELTGIEYADSLEEMADYD